MENTQKIVAVEAQVPKWKTELPPGYKFVPDDLTLFNYYLIPRVKGEYFPPGIIREANVYQCQPSELLDLDLEETFTYFFTKVEKKCKNGKRSKRITMDQKGSWKITSKINEIKADDGLVIGRKNTLVYTLGNNNVANTNWIMHEYVLDDNYMNTKQDDETTLVLCRIHERKAGKQGDSDDGSPTRGVQENHIKREFSSNSKFGDAETAESSKRLKGPSQDPSCSIEMQAQPVDQMIYNNIAHHDLMIWQPLAATNVQEILPPLDHQMASYDSYIGFSEFDYNEKIDSFPRGSNLNGGIQGISNIQADDLFDNNYLVAYGRE